MGVKGASTELGFLRLCLKRYHRFLRRVQAVIDPGIAIVTAMTLIIGAIAFGSENDPEPVPEPLGGEFNVAVALFCETDMTRLPRATSPPTPR